LDGLADIPFSKEIEDCMMEAGGVWNKDGMLSLNSGTRFYTVMI